MPRSRVRVWDLPTRLFHWLLVLLIAAAYFTQKFNKMEAHYLCGEAILALLLFRLIWGFVGSDSARFLHFLKSPVAATQHLLHLTKREPDDEPGHNAAGGWMVLGLLGLIGLQVVTGLFSSDDDAFLEAPLRHLIGAGLSEQLTKIHHLLFNVLMLAVIAHIGAVVVYLLLKGHNLVRPMLTGWKELDASVPVPRIAKTANAAAIFVATALLVFLLVRFA